jgi:hypothetical protein
VGSILVLADVFAGTHIGLLVSSSTDGAVDMVRLVRISQTQSIASLINCGRNFVVIYMTGILLERGPQVPNAFDSFPLLMRLE